MKLASIAEAPPDFAPVTGAKVRLFPEPHKHFNNNLVIWPKIVWLFGQNSFPHLADFRSGVWPKQKSEGRYNSDLRPKNFTTMMSTIPATRIQKIHFSALTNLEPES